MGYTWNLYTEGDLLVIDRDGDIYIELDTTAKTFNFMWNEERKSIVSIGGEINDPEGFMDIEYEEETK